jgi:integrase
MTMGRKPTANLNLPPHMRARKRGEVTYYFYDLGGKPRKEKPLGKSYIDAVKQWAELEGENHKAIFYFKDVADKYLLEVIPRKSQTTQDGNILELNNLLKYFNDPPAPIADIKPIHVRQYMNWRTKNGTEALVRANREKALLSHIFNMAREWGVLDTANPCLGIKGFKEDGRDVYTENNIFEAVYNESTQPLKDAIDLAYLTGQRPGDTIAMSETHLIDGELYVKQGKTNSKLRIAVTGELEVLINRILERKKTYKVRTLQLICTETGRPISQNALRLRFDRAREKAIKRHPKLEAEIKNFQFRDLRAKAASDKTDSDSIHAAQKQLGHTTLAMTEQYVRPKRGQKVSPTR